MSAGTTVHYDFEVVDGWSYNSTVPLPERLECPPACTITIPFGEQAMQVMTEWLTRFIVRPEETRRRAKLRARVDPLRQRWKFADRVDDYAGFLYPQDRRRAMWAYVMGITLREGLAGFVCLHHGGARYRIWEMDA